MSLTLTDRFVDDVAVVICSGRIVEGAETTALQQRVQTLMSECRYIVLDLAAVDFIDSSGVGVLVRLLTRAQHAGGALTVSAMSARVREAIRITHLDRVFRHYESEAEAIAGLSRRSAPTVSAAAEKRILCVHSSADVLAYLREVLRPAGYSALTADNLVDALTLITANAPSVLVIEAGLRAARDTRTAKMFNERADRLPVIELDSGFSADDAGHAGQELLRRLGSVRLS